MASWVVPDEGKIEWLARALLGSGLNIDDYVFKLYQNNYTPVDGSTASDFTIATFTGYANVTVAHGTFPTPTITSHVAISAVTPINFTCTGGSSQTCYGVVVIGSVSGKVLLAALFDTPRVMTTGATETITPQVKLKTFA